MKRENKEKNSVIYLRLNSQQTEIVRRMAQQKGISELNAVRLIISTYKEDMHNGR